VSVDAEGRVTREARTDRLPAGSTVALLTASTILAGAYGATALVSLRVAELGGNAATAGGVISSGTLFTLLFAVLSGHLTHRIGRMNCIIIGGVALAASMAILGSANHIGWSLLLAGILLGTGWALFYVLLPIYVVSLLVPHSRIKYLTLISGFQMLGIGASPVAGRWSVAQQIPLSRVFQCLAVGGLVACVLFVAVGRNLGSLTRKDGLDSRLNWNAVPRIFAGNARYPVIMIGLGACIFSSLSTFQTILAQTWKRDYGLFFVLFIVTVVGCRLLFAAQIGRYDPFKVLLALLSTMVLGLLLMFRAADGVLLYGLAAVLFGIGYGLAYSVLNGILANTVDADILPQALQIFTCSYFLGMFGFPAIAGVLLTQFGVDGTMAALVGIGSLELGLAIVMAARFGAGKEAPRHPGETMSKQAESGGHSRPRAPRPSPPELLKRV
jgi:MFS family permease